MISSTTTENPNGWQAVGQVTIWVLNKLQGADLHVYLAIAKSTIGYKQYTSELLPYAMISKLTNLSIRTIERTVPYLIEQGYILRIATNQVAYTAKLPYKYQLNMQLPNFPNLGKLRKSREPEPIIKPDFICPPTTDYIVDGKSIRLLSTIDPAKLTLMQSRNSIMHPTINQLTAYLKEH